MMRECDFDGYAHACCQSLLANRVLLSIMRSKRLGRVEEQDARALLKGKEFFTGLVKSAEDEYFAEDSLIPFQDLDLIIEASGRRFINKEDFVDYLQRLEEEVGGVLVGSLHPSTSESVEDFLKNYQRLQSIRFHELGSVD